MKTTRLASAVLALLFVACSSSGGIEISDARIAQPTGPNAAMYFTATSDGGSDRLIGVSTDAATSVQIHETTVGDDGTMGMHPVDGLDVPAGGDLVLEPGGLHLMLIDADRAEVGDTFEITLSWENAGDMTMEVPVVAPNDVAGSDG